MCFNFRPKDQPLFFLFFTNRSLIFFSVVSPEMGSDSRHWHTQRQTTRSDGFLMRLVSSQPASGPTLVPSICHLHHLHLRDECFHRRQPTARFPIPSSNTSRDPSAVSLEVRWAPHMIRAWCRWLSWWRWRLIPRQPHKSLKNNECRWEQ